MKNRYLLLIGSLVITLGTVANVMKSSTVTNHTPTEVEMIKKITTTLVMNSSELGDSSEEHDMLGNSVTTVDWNKDVQIIYSRTDDKSVLTIQVGDVTISDPNLDAQTLVVKKITGEILKDSSKWHNLYRDLIRQIHQRIIAYEVGPGP